MKGILLAGGSGSRLFPMTLAVSKQLLPVFDKPLIYYPLGVLIEAGVRDLLVISGPAELPAIRRLLGDGASLGLAISYAEQARPLGIADALRIGRDFVGSSPVALVLGDNIFHGAGLAELSRRAAARTSGATVFAAEVDDPKRYGVVGFDAAGRPASIVEKPAVPASDWAVTGLYFYDNRVLDVAAGLEPSARGELEISDINRWYLRQGRLTVERLDRGVAWFDAGTPESLHEAAAFVRTIQNRRGAKIMCPEELAMSMGLIGPSEVMQRADALGHGDYATYLRVIARAAG